MTYSNLRFMKTESDNFPIETKFVDQQEKNKICSFFLIPIITINTNLGSRSNFNVNVLFKQGENLEFEKN